LQAFAYSVSHDLQEPLRNQSVYSELLERRHGDSLPPEAHQYVRVIRGSALRMQDMLRSLLLYSRVGQADREKNLVDCGEIVKRVLTDLESLLRRVDARVEVGPMPRVWAWEDRLQQVFQNLIENAAKYRKQDVPPWITISAEEQPGEAFGAAVAKALAHPPVAAEWCLPLVREGGAAVLWVGPSADESAVARVAARLAGELDEAPAGFIVVRKTGPTPM
jgi:light-regulated signal transduction histidine kinase (bacteriophytochrome)